MRIPVAVKFENGEQTLNIEAVNVPNSDGQLYIMAQPTGNFTVLLYDYTSKETLYEATVEYGNNIEFKIECPENANTTHQLQLLFYTGEKGKTAYINSTYINVKVEDTTNKENPVKIFSTIPAADDTTPTIGDIDYQWRRIVVLDNSNGIVPGNTYRITIGKASYIPYVTTYMQYKITDCSESIEGGNLTVNTTNITFYIKEIWSNDLGETKEYSYKSGTFTNMKVYEYTDLGPDKSFAYVDASELVDTILGLQKNSIDYNNISYNGTTRTLTEELGYNLKSIGIECETTGVTFPVSIPLFNDGNNKGNFYADIYAYTGTVLGAFNNGGFIFDSGNLKAKIVYKYNNNYYVMQALNEDASFSKCLQHLHPNAYTSAAGSRYFYNASYIEKYIGTTNYEFFNIKDNSLLKIDNLSYIQDGDVEAGYVIGDIQKVNGSLLGAPTVDEKNNVNYWKLSSAPTYIELGIKKIGGSTSFFASSIPRYISIQGENINITGNAFSNLKKYREYEENGLKRYEGTKYYAPGYANALFGEATRVNTYEELFNSDSTIISNKIDVSPFNPGITPKSYEMNMYDINKIYDSTWDNSYASSVVALYSSYDYNISEMILDKRSSIYNYTTLLYNVTNGMGVNNKITVTIEDSIVDPTNISSFTIGLYDFDRSVNDFLLDSNNESQQHTGKYGKENSFEFDTSVINNKHDVRLIIYSGEYGKTANIKSIYKNIKMTINRKHAYRYINLYNDIKSGYIYDVNIKSAKVVYNVGNKPDKFTCLLYEPINGSSSGNGLKRVNIPFGENIKFNIYLDNDINTTHEVWLLLYAGEPGSTSGNVVLFDDIEVYEKKLYTIADYYSYDNIQLGPDSYGRGG